MEGWLAFWVSSSVGERKRLISTAWRLTLRSLENFQRVGDSIGFGRTYNQLASTAGIQFVHEWNIKTRQLISRQAAELGEEAIKQFSGEHDPEDLARAYTITATYAGVVAYFSGASAREALLKKSDDLWVTALQISERAALLEMVAHSRFTSPNLGILGSDEAIATLEKTLEFVRESKNKLLISSTLDYLVHHLHYRTASTEDRVEYDALVERWQRLARESDDLYSRISAGIPRRSAAMIVSPYAEHYWQTALLETDKKEKLETLELALKEALSEITDSDASGVAEAIANSNHFASKVFASLARIEEDPSRKTAFLRKALYYRRKAKTLDHKIIGVSDFWNRGLHENYLSDIEAERVPLVETAGAKGVILSKAIKLKETCLKLCGDDKIALNWGSKGPSPYWGFLGKYQLECGDMYVKLYEFHQRSEHLNLAAERFRTAADSFEKVNQKVRMAGANWKAGIALQRLGEHVLASECYGLASNSYNHAAQKIPLLKEFYEQLSLHMQARSEMEKARDHHNRGDYGAAEESYRKAALWQSSSGRWNYLSNNLLALARLETAEEKSCREKGDEASLAFKEAARAFHESRILVETRIADIDGPEDTKEAEALIQTSRIRELYATARAELEEARILIMRGEHRSASEKYSRAIDVLQNIARGVQGESDKKEADFIVTLSKAWRMMARAEAESLPELYETASALFEKAKESCLSDNARTLLLGHGRYSSSLYSVSRFLDRGGALDYRVAMQRLESASNFYVTAGFHNASEHAKATRRLLEAHLYLIKATREKDQEKKARLFTAAERLLRASGDSFGESGYLAKKEHVTRLLDRVREDRDLAISLRGDLSASFSMPSGFLSSPITSREEIVGAEKLQRAYIVANIYSSPTNLRIGESMNVKIELANAGVDTAQLVRVERMLPEGFELVEKPKELPFEERNLILKGRRLEPLKTEELRLTLRPRVEGPLALNPRILYLDENGQGRVHEPDPVEIMVRDRAPIDQIPLPIARESLQDSPIIRFLTGAFVEDYMRRRLALEHAGWRGLPDIVRSLKISRSQVYGDSRYKHTFGKPLERFVKKGIVEFRVFPGMRGRGGNIVRVRVAYEKEPVKRFVDSLALTLST